MRLAQSGEERPDDAALQALLERARAGLEALALTTAELETGIPERLDRMERVLDRIERALDDRAERAASVYPIQRQSPGA